jgi:hypothetical protein
MHVSQDHIKNILALIAQCGLREKLGIHMLHKHESIPKGQVKLETKLETTAGKWIKPIPIDSLDLNNMHGVVFKFVAGEHRFVPYEFGEGPSPVSMSDVVNKCIEKFVDYITKNNLVDVIALEFLDSVKDGQPKECTAEVEVGNGTVVLPKSIVNGSVFIPTGWPDTSQPGDPDGEPDPGTHWAPVKVGTKETHRVFVDQIENETELLDKLAHLKFIKV